MAVTKRIRYEVLRRDGHRCRYCGLSVEDGAKLTVDHVVPVALGGTDDPSNLVAACIDCNLGKASSSPSGDMVAQVADDAVRWAAAMRRAAEIAAAEAEELANDVAWFDYQWNTWTVTGTSQTVPREATWEQSIETWLKAGLTIHDLTGLIPSAMRKGIVMDRRWRYFCGCAWNLTRQRQDQARALIDAGADL